MNKKTPRSTLEDLKTLLERLRAENGCPWDRKQTTESLKIYLLEETYELAEALDRKIPDGIKEELGDLLFQIVFLAGIFEERGDFELSDVITSVHQKMVRRHPHVFGKEKWNNAKEVVQGWQEIKAEEKKGEDPFASIPVALPALLKAHRLSQRASGLGFDWPNLQGVMDKVREELRELEEAIEDKNRLSAEEELGDLLFALVNVGRFLEVQAENALRGTTQKFLKRFRTMIRDASFKEKGGSSLSAEEWDKLWIKAKGNDEQGS